MHWTVVRRNVLKKTFFIQTYLKTSQPKKRKEKCSKHALSCRCLGNDIPSFLVFHKMSNLQPVQLRHELSPSPGPCARNVFKMYHPKKCVVPAGDSNKAFLHNKGNVSPTYFPWKDSVRYCNNKFSFPVAAMGLIMWCWFHSTTIQVSVTVFVATTLLFRNWYFILISQWLPREKFNQQFCFQKCFINRPHLWHDGMHKPHLWNYTMSILFIHKSEGEKNKKNVSKMFPSNLLK